MKDYSKYNVYEKDHSFKFSFEKDDIYSSFIIDTPPEGTEETDKFILWTDWLTDSIEECMDKYVKNIKDNRIARIVAGACRRLFNE